MGYEHIGGSTYQKRERQDNKVKYLIRMMQPTEYSVLNDFLYEAIFQRDESNRLPRSIIREATLKIYADDFGKTDDDCLCAEVDGKIVGAVWTRNINGYGSVDEQTPEFAISLYKEYRGYGIGTAMMKSMLELLRSKGYEKASLAVQKDNYALKMYQKVGFQIIDENSEEYIMIYYFNGSHPSPGKKV